jgi:hypothetical protein
MLDARVKTRVALSFNRLNHLVVYASNLLRSQVRDHR